MTSWGKTDNSATKEKAAMRRKFLPDKAHVLDLFCGTGSMYHHAYQGIVKSYTGIDKEKVHSPEMCYLMDNKVFVTHHDLGKYNVFDLDDHGCPWTLFYLIMRKLTEQKEIVIFITDGLVQHMKVDGTVSKMVSATENVPQKMNLPGINRFYEDIFATMLLDVERRYGWQTTNAVYFHNDKRSVYYWALKIVRI